MNDYASFKAMENGFSPYEQVKIGYMQSKRASGTAIGGLATAIGAAVVGLGGWFFAATQAKAAKDVAIAKNDGLRDLVLTQAQTIAAERQERIAGDLNITTTINDTVSGSQQGQLSASQIATNEATAQIVAGVMTGKYAETPQKVELLTPAQPFQCGCGCNG